MQPFDPNFNSKTTIVSLSILVTMCGSVFVVQPLIIGSLISLRGYTETIAGFVTTSEFAAFAIGVFILSRVIHTSNRQRLGFFSVLLFIIANVLSGLSASYEALIFLRITSGFAASGMCAVGVATAAGTRDPDKTWAYISVCSLIYSMLLLAVGSILVEHWGTAGLFFGVAVLAIICLPLPRLLPRRAQEESTVAVRTHANKMFTPKTLALLAAAFFVGIAYTATWSFPERIGANLGIKFQEVGLILSSSMGAGLAATFLVLLVGTRYGRFRMLGIAFALSALSAYALPGVGGKIGYIVCINFFVFGFHLISPYMGGLASSFDTSGRVVAVYVTALNLGVAAGPIIGGYAVESYGYWHLGLAAAVCYAVGCFLVLPISRQEDRARREGELEGISPGDSRH